LTTQCGKAATYQEQHIANYFKCFTSGITHIQLSSYRNLQGEKEIIDLIIL